MSTESELIPQQENASSESVSTQPAQEVNRELAPPADSTQPAKSINSSIISASELPEDSASSPAEEGNKNSKSAEEQPSNDVKSTPNPSHGVASLTNTSPEDTDKDWVDLLGNQQLMKKVVRTGRGLTTRPTPQSRVRVSVKGCLESGTVVEKQKTIEFTVGDGDVVQALDLAVTLMETGEISEVKTSPRFAYGSVGREPDIPANSTLLYEVELLEVMEPLNYTTLSQEDLLAAVDKKRVRGNELFKRQEYDRAIHSYQKGLQMLKAFTEEHGEGAGGELVVMQIRCWNNVAAAQLKVEMHKEVLESCEKVLEKEPDNVKALFRSGKVLSLMGEMDEAVRRLQRAAGVDKEEKAIKQELQRAIQRREHMREKEKAMYQRMVSGKPKATSKTSTKLQNGPASWGPWPYLAAAMAVAAVGIGMAYFITQRH